MKRSPVFILFLFLSLYLYGQDVSVEAKGVGTDRNMALHDAFRMAVSQAVGTYVQAETQVENFITIKDAIVTKATGYIKKYEILKEVPLPGSYEITIRAEVSTDPLKQDANILAQFIGGLRFLVLYDSREFNDLENTAGEFITERFNEALSERKIRYIEKNRFNQIKGEALRTLLNDTSEASYVQKLGLLADAEFIIFVKNVRIQSEKKGEVWSTKVTIDVKAYDNCTAEGLGTVVMEGSYKLNPDRESSLRIASGDAVLQGFDSLMLLFNQYLGEWISSGAPFELKFYGMGSPRSLRALILKLQSDPDYGGQMSDPSIVENVIKLNMTFKKKPFDLYNKIIDYADEIPELKAKEVDARIMYGRQISFAPLNVTVPDAIERKKTETSPSVN